MVVAQRPSFGSLGNFPGCGALWQEKLKPAYDELFGKEDSDPLAPTKLAVIDRATDEALKRMIESGLIASTTRATRGLHPADGGAAKAPLSPDEEQKARAYRERARRKLTMARVLASGGLSEEERDALRESMLFLGRALAVEKRATEPANLDEALRAPAALVWGDALPVLRELALGSDVDSVPVAKVLEEMVETAVA